MNPASAPVLADATATPAVAPAPRATPSSGAWPIAILGVPFDHVSIEESVARIEAMIATRRPHFVVTANVDFLVQAHRDVELRRILLEADLVLCDGTPLVWASRWLGNALPERVAGSDLAPALIEAAAKKGHRLFFLGAAEGVALEAEAKLKAQYPTLQIVGTYSPPFSPLLEMDHAEIAKRIRAAQPDILLVSFGCPKQEKWIAMHHRSLGVPVAIGVGATLDFLAGRMKRAPALMRRTGTEWLYRLWQEPGRLYQRYATDLVHFLPALARQTIRLPVRPAARPTLAERAAPLPEWSHFYAGGDLTRRSLQRDAALWQQLPDRSTHCLVDLADIKAIDATGIAHLIRARKALAARGRQLVLHAPSAKVQRLLGGLKLSDHFLVARDVADAIRQVAACDSHPPVQHDGTTRSLAWCGEIVSSNAEDVWRMTSEHVLAFAANHTSLVIIDLARLRFIDSTGAALMLRLKKWAKSVQAEILFAHPQPNVRNVLRLTRIDHLVLEGGQ